MSQATIDHRMNDRFPLPPGATIGIMGGGQLGRMTALAAAPFGYRCHVFTPESDSPTEQVCDSATVAAYEDKAALTAFAGAVDVVTFEFENVPYESVQLLESLVPVRPGWNVLRVSQDRIVEKDFINNLGIPTTAYRVVRSIEELSSAIDAIGAPSVLKTTRLGYDGKGQTMVSPDTNASEAWQAIQPEKSGGEAILEAFVDLAMEVSVIVARGADGTSVAYPTVENRHKNHILDTTHAPADVSGDLARQAEDAAQHIAEALGVIGLLAVEMFITTDGQLLINEIAPRPHNSGHWTMDACSCSQFEQFVRAVAGLPLAPTAPHHDAIMQNLIGDDIDRWRDAVAEPNAHLHTYGKAEARAGRKMGHINRLYSTGQRPA